MEHQEIKDLLPVAALERLEGDEAQAVSEHLRAGCDECEAELRAYREVAASLALSLEPVGSHSRIMDRLQERLAASGASARQLRGIRRRDKLTRAERSGLTGWRVATGIAAAAFVAVSVFAAVLINRAARSGVEFEQEIALREAQLRELRSQLTSSGKQVDTLERVLNDRMRLEQILLAPDLRLTRLEPLKPAPGSAGLVAVSEASGAALIQVSGLPPTPSGKTYELWWITKESGPVRAALFQVHGPHTVVAEAEPPPAGQHALLGAVTLEPAGGTNSPTGAMYLKGTVG
jgi:anti-sigma-K factor RskA